MLSESGLSKSFWGDCLASLVHVWNRCPTEAVQDATPYELWYKRKPDVSHIRVWGCTAYVHIQRDKRTPLGPHMEKCIFLGYPDGYKGWKFFNPLTRRTVISERADSDERYFPALKSHSQVVSTAPHTVNSFLPASTPISNNLDTNPLVPGPMDEEEEGIDPDNMDQGGHDHAPIAPLHQQSLLNMIHMIQIITKIQLPQFTLLCLQLILYLTNNLLHWSRLFQTLKMTFHLRSDAHREYIDHHNHTGFMQETDLKH